MKRTYQLVPDPQFAEPRGAMDLAIYLHLGAVCGIVGMLGFGPLGAVCFAPMLAGAALWLRKRSHRRAYRAELLARISRDFELPVTESILNRIGAQRIADQFDGTSLVFDFGSVSLEFSSTERWSSADLTVRQFARQEG